MGSKDGCWDERLLLIGIGIASRNQSKERGVVERYSGDGGFLEQCVDFKESKTLPTKSGFGRAGGFKKTGGGEMRKRGRWEEARK